MTELLATVVGFPIDRGTEAPGLTFTLSRYGQGLDGNLHIQGKKLAGQCRWLKKIEVISAGISQRFFFTLNVQPTFLLFAIPSFVPEFQNLLALH